MSNEIKVVYGDVGEALADLKTATEAFAHSPIPSLTEGLDCAKKLNELFRKLSELEKTYQRLLANNEKASRQAMESFKKVDQSVASFMK
ncbi:DUF5344 family protein [Fictibacillus gelatini]|uniref:DUF5344 family protein n=1 Tax=Fictibacillus gelatini TaxID=225985 RepID=UPI000418D1B1|nr:DUF5344 family protein [Fictibacillus gelatini]